MQRYTAFSDILEFPRLHKPGLLVFGGSCFAQNIAAYFEQALWPVAYPPLGAVYQPKALLRQVQWLLQPVPETACLFCGQDGLWRSWLAHHKLAESSPDKVLQRLLQKAQIWQESLHHAAVICLTVAHPLTWYEKEAGPVANCHKEPAARFTKKFCSEEDCAEDLRTLVQLIRGVNSRAPIFFTLSPVRYLAEGMVFNFLGKTRLRIALDRLCRLENNVWYFPAYEIIMDDLRDYRYYKDDMLHPTDQAVHYVGGIFRAALSAPATDEFHKQGVSWMKRWHHKPFQNVTTALDPKHEILKFVQQHWPAEVVRHKEHFNVVFRE